MRKCRQDSANSDRRDWVHLRADMVEKSAVLVIGHDQHGLFEQLGISGEGIIDIGNEVLAKSHILGSVL